MIPAILSCIFAFYLYQSLNKPTADDTATVGDTATAGGEVNEETLSARLSELQSRLEALSASQDGKGI